MSMGRYAASQMDSTYPHPPYNPHPRDDLLPEDELYEEQLEELYSWLDQIPLSRKKRHVARDFSDGVLVAEVVKHHFPKLVDMHNYVTSNATAQKKKNWLLLNRKVLCKLDCEINEGKMLNDVVCAKQGQVERVLYKIHFYCKKCQMQQAHQENEHPEADQNSYRSSPRKETKNVVHHPNKGPRDGYGGGGGVEQAFKNSKAPQDEFVPLILLEEKEQEVLAKNETIQILQAKIKRLEHLLHLKDIRIDDQQRRIESMRPTGKR